MGLIYFTWKHEGKQTQHTWTLTGDTEVWEQVRYRYEREHKYFASQAFLKAWFATTKEPVTSTTFISSGDHLIFAREAMKPHWKPYTPLAFVPKPEVHSVADVMACARKTPDVGRHATDLQAEEATGPAETYVCHRCGAQGQHFVAYCPTLQDQTFMPVCKRKKPKGIPQMFLREAVSEQDFKNAMYYEVEDRWVVRK